VTVIAAEDPILPGARVIDLAGSARRDPVLCFSHLRWDFVFQRPQHLMTRFARTRPVIYFEEPVPDDGDAAWLRSRVCDASGVIIATPHLPTDLPETDREGALKGLVDGLLAEQGIQRPVLWYYTPMMLPFSRHLKAAAVVYDCMDELANFRFAPPSLRPLEQELIATADVVFTGGFSLYEAKAHLHANIHPFPSSVDRTHFAQARAIAPDERPTLGFYGVIDERMDLDLIASVADARPDWTLMMVGPVVKISPDDLPRRPNIQYLGARDYDALPGELGRWHVALMPFAINDSTQFISPTKTPEYLAGGRPVVSTPIRDVVRHYGDLEAVIIAGDPETFVAACDTALALAADAAGAWREAADAVLADLSWDQTHVRMSTLVDRAATARPTTPRSSVGGRSRKAHYDALVVGAGFAGAVLAERLANDAGLSVLVVDRRPHIGGNAYDRLDAAGVLIHEYGPHIFHTNSADVFAYLSRFTRWRPYEHRVLAEVDDKLVPMPINRTTLNLLYDLHLETDDQAAAWLAARAEPVEKIQTSEDVVVSAVGRELYETFFRGYTRKQWGLDPSELDKSVTSRVPTRTNTDDRYFTDTFQAMPLEGYTKMFERMLDHENIRVETGVDYRDIVDEVAFDRLIYTGPIDEFFGHCYGPLPYRSLRFQHETLDQAWFQSVATVNSPAEATPYTRVTEYKHLTGQTHPKTSVTFEYPTAEGDPYYPIPRAENQALFKRYEALAQGRPDVVFAGRLATYRYYNMDQVVGQALATYRKMPARPHTRASAGEGDAAANAG